MRLEGIRIGFYVKIKGTLIDVDCQFMHFNSRPMLPIIAFLATGITLAGCYQENPKSSSVSKPEIETKAEEKKAPDSESLNEANKLAGEAIALEKKGETQEALELYNKSIALYPNQILSRFHRGMIYFKALEFKKTVEDLEVVRKENPKWVAKSNLILGKAYTEMSEYEKSNEILKVSYQKLTPPPVRAKALRILSDNYKSLKNYEEALKYINEALKMDPASGVLRADRVKLYMALNQKDKALEELDYILKNKKPGHRDYFNHALLLMEKKRYTEAIEDLNKIINHKTYNREYLRLRLKAARKAGMKELAKQDELRLKNFDDLSGPPSSVGQSFNQQ